jgi:hypothetical protein
MQSGVQCDIAFNPTMEPMRVVRKKILQKVAGSLKNKIPIKTVPTAPIPVHTAYAVPMGMVLVAFINNNMLIDKATKKPVYHHKDVLPVVSLAFPRQDAKATSSNPATIKIIKFILFVLLHKAQVGKREEILQMINNEFYRISARILLRLTWVMPK